jgi:hypothetical protein
MKLVVCGKTNKEIGASLRVSEGTVKVHVGHILNKLGAGGRTEAIRICSGAWDCGVPRQNDDQPFKSRLCTAGFDPSNITNSSSVKLKP